jgi:hypothetical protein
MTEAQHNRAIARAAKAVLEPMGCIRKGTSRTWLDDHGWWVGVIEFQPSKWSKGSYLNVGACWLWTTKDYFSFDDGYRIEDFKEFKNDEQFQQAAQNLAERAKSEVAVLRERFHSVKATAQYLATKQSRPDDIWAQYHAGVSAGLIGDVSTARARLQTVTTMQEREVDWVLELKKKAANLLTTVEDRSLFRGAVEANIEKARKLLKLPQRSEPIEL